MEAFPAIGVLDWMVAAARWAHLMGAVAWVGGGTFYILVVRPALRRAPVGGEPLRAIGAEFRGLVDTAIIVLIVTGIILSAVNLRSPDVTTAYVAFLALKIAVAVYAFILAALLRRRAPSRQPIGEAEQGGWLHRLRRELTGPTAALVAGVVVIGLAEVLAAVRVAGLVS